MGTEQREPWIRPDCPNCWGRGTIQDFWGRYADCLLCAFLSYPGIPVPDRLRSAAEELHLHLK